MPTNEKKMLVINNQYSENIANSNHFGLVYFSLWVHDISHNLIIWSRICFCHTITHEKSKKKI